MFSPVYQAELRLLKEHKERVIEQLKQMKASWFKNDRREGGNGSKGVTLEHTDTFVVSLYY